ncbi:MAG TPA: hypothetical protein VJW20_04475 [Candidatus Angelobacter sp.]|nr:hypothetical protein [Candidatus Angelobacter sp.]
MATEEEARAVKQRHSFDLLKRPGVCGVGVEKDDSGDYIIALHLESDDPKLREQLPQQLEGVRVKQLHSGPFRPL